MRMRMRMRKIGVSLVLCLSLTVGGAAAAGPVVVNGASVDAGARIYNNTTYVSLRAVSEALYPESVVTWEYDRAVVRVNDLVLTAVPGSRYIEADGRTLYAAGGVRLESGRTLVPVRVLADGLGANVYWDAKTGTVSVWLEADADTGGDVGYDADSVYWLSRIISAERRGEPLDGKIAVGNVVLNRVADGGFPNTIYGVIFDDRWGGQFEPVRNGTIYDEPTEESVLAAKLCLEGANTAGDSLYFLAPALTTNHWIMQNRTYRTTIGSHWFYY